MFGMNAYDRILFNDLVEKVDKLQTRVSEQDKKIKQLKLATKITIPTGKKEWIRSPFGGLGHQVPETTDIQLIDIIKMVLTHLNVSLTHTPKNCTEPKTELVKVKPVKPAKKDTKRGSQ